MNIMKITLIKSLISLLAILLSSLSFAHHSSTEFTNARVEMEGRLIQVSWRNPHPSLTFQSANTGELWNIQLPGTIESLSARGITLNTFVIGQNLNIAGLPSRRLDNFLQVTHVLLPDGKELILKAGSQPVWTQSIEIVNEALIANDVITSDISGNILINDKIFIIFSIFIALMSAFAISTFRVKSLQESF